MIGDVHDLEFVGMASALSLVAHANL